MSNYDAMPVVTLTKLVNDDRQNLRAADAGTGLTHLNDAAILARKAGIARKLVHMAFSLRERDAMPIEEFDVIVNECRPYQAHATPSAKEPAHSS
jgi:hypothetical protein